MGLDGVNCLIRSSQNGSLNYSAWSTFLDFRKHLAPWQVTFTIHTFGQAHLLRVDREAWRNCWDHEEQAPELPTFSFLLKQPLLVCDSFLTTSNKKEGRFPREIISDKCLWSYGFQTAFLEASGIHFMDEGSILPWRSGGRALEPFTHPCSQHWSNFTHFIWGSMALFVWTI